MAADYDDDPCFCGCCCPLIKCGWNNGWRIILFACALGVVVVLCLASWLFVQALRVTSESTSKWTQYAAPLFFAAIACLACLCGGCIWVIMCPRRERKKRRKQPVVMQRHTQQAPVVYYPPMSRDANPMF